MFAGDVRFEGFTASDWTRVLSLFRPPMPPPAPREPPRPRGGLFCVQERGSVRKLVHTERGRLPPSDAGATFPCSPRSLAEAVGASYCVILEAGALEEIMDRFAERTRHGDDVTAQSLTLIQAIHEQVLVGRVQTWPELPLGLPGSSEAMIRRGLDMVCPVHRTLVLGLFEGGELWTSLAVRRGPQGFDLFLGPQEVREDVGRIAGDFRADYRRVCATIERRSGPVALGCFAEVSTVRRLEVDASPGAWARAVALRQVVLSPLPAALAIPLAIDAGRGTLTAARTLAQLLRRLGLLPDPPQPTGRSGRVHPLEMIARLLSAEP